MTPTVTHPSIFHLALPARLARLLAPLAARPAGARGRGLQEPGSARPSALDGSNAAVVDWSVAAYDAFVAEDKYANPLRAARVLAMVHLAQHDALAAIRPTYAPHALTERSPDADPVAAAASAAFEVLAAELPGQRPALAARLARSLEALPDAGRPGQGRGPGPAGGRGGPAAPARRRLRTAR